MTSMELTALSGLEAQRLLSEGKITALELTEACLGPDRRRRATRPGLGFPRSRARPRPGQALRRGAAPRPAAGAAARHPGRHQGHHRYPRHADRERHRAARRAPADQGRRGGRAAARRGRGDPGQDRDHRACRLSPGQDAQPARPRTHARRLLVGLGGGGGSGHGAARGRLADQRLGDPPGELLRRVRLQALARPDLALWRARPVTAARPHRRVRAHARGPRPDRRAADRLRCPRPRHAARGRPAPARGGAPGLAAGARPRSGQEPCLGPGRGRSEGRFCRACGDAGPAHHRGRSARRLCDARTPSTD